MTFMDTKRFREYLESRAQQTHCREGHPLTPANTRMQICVREGRKYVIRICRACQRARRRRLTA